ncbi:MAG TPA: SemiSWEET family transporter [Candidatus Paceibacterota bacterium]|jgi:MtN3 and saliva related transmembrane protein
MTLDSVIQATVTVVGFAFSIGYYPQAYKIFKTKSAGDVSISSFIIFVIGTTVWTFYGFYERNITIILSFFLGMVGSWLVLFLTLYYRRKGPEA